VIGRGYNGCQTSDVRHWIEVAIALEAELLRIEVSDSNRRASLRPRTADIRGGWGLTLIGELATRWGVERQSTGKTVWIEFDLRPG
jgi:hypothetical protein